MSKIKTYLDTDILFTIINDNFNDSNLDCISSMQAVTELLVKYNLTNETKNVFAILGQKIKIRYTDYEVLEKFNQIYDKNPENASLYLHYSVAILENCEYFVTESKILNVVGIKTVLRNELVNKFIENNTLFDF